MTIGVVDLWPTEVIPENYIICNGAAVSRTTYADLFALIDVAYGSGDGSTTFNLPDLRGYFPRCYTGGSTIDPGSRTARPTAGPVDGTGTTQTDANLSHNHSHSSGNSTSFGSYPGKYSIGYSNNGFNTQSTGGSESRPVNITLNPIIRHTA